MRRLLRRYRRHSPEAQGSRNAEGFTPRNVRKEQGSPDVVVLKPERLGMSKPSRREHAYKVLRLRYSKPFSTRCQTCRLSKRSSLRRHPTSGPIKARHSILSSILLRDIHPDVLFDALAIIDTLELPRDDDDYVSHLKAFLEHYKTMRASPDVALQRLEPKTKKALSEFHPSVIDKTEDFYDYALSTHPVTGQSLYHFTSLSPHENTSDPPSFLPL